MLRNAALNVLIQFPHGLGDCVDYGIVLKHIKQHYPKVTIDVATHANKQGALQGIADNTLIIGKPNLKKYDYSFHEPFIYANLAPGWGSMVPAYGVPPTKVTHTLLENFGIKPQKELYYCDFFPSETAILINDKLNEEVIHNKKYAVVNYVGATNKDNKELTQKEAHDLCNLLVAKGYLCLIADYFNTCPFTDNKNIFPLARNNDCGVLYELIRRANLFIGIDSGPAHIAATTGTPSYIMWMEAGYHPLTAINFTHNCTHLMPDSFMNCDELFFKEYTWKKYGTRNKLLDCCNEFIGTEQPNINYTI